MLFPKKIIKHYGLFRSGTNYFEAIVRGNYHATVDLSRYGWKHGFVEDSVPCDTVLVVKNIHAWLVSIYNYAVNRNHFSLPASIRFSDFLRHRYVWRGNTGFDNEQVEQEADNPIMYWNQMVGHWFSRTTFVLRYEDLLANPEASLNFIRRTSKEFQYPSGDVSPGLGAKATYVAKPDYAKIGYYLSGGYMSSYSSEDLAYVANQTNRTLVTMIQRGKNG